MKTEYEGQHQSLDLFRRKRKSEDGAERGEITLRKGLESPEIVDLKIEERPDESGRCWTSCLRHTEVFTTLYPLR
ncbi:hypothetical protein RRG08_039446 [Elysia crispata]|uniref:Uncharacterized protein n=1 Tax=Elysia crispata TaxID=231223 RepID=A0AAE1AAQ7_9GAST|nr:hypothetical protein RRG08_039446 [Elysia crispata]